MLKPREAVAALSPYEPENYQAKIYLAANENPYDVPSELKAEILALSEKLPYNRYPDPFCDELRATIAAAYSLKPANVVVGNGGDELLLYLLLAYGGQQSKALTFTPTFVMYEILSQLTATPFISLPRDSQFQLPTNFLQFAKEEQPKLVFLCSPNNPSGNLVDPQAVAALLDTECLVVLDEAYAEFSGFSLASWLQANENLIILRTFSKAFSLAGLRLGYMLANEEVITNICKVKLPYNVNRFTSLAGLVLWQHQEKLKPTIKLIVEQREWLYKQLKELSWLQLYPSAANFIFAKSQKPNLWHELLAHGILVRRFNFNKEEFVRITVGKPEENQQLVAVLASL